MCIRDRYVTVTYSLRLFKSEIDEDPICPKWKESVWDAIKKLRNVDDEIVVRPDGSAFDAFKSFGGFDAPKLHLALKAEVATQAMLSPVYKQADLSPGPP